MEVKSLAITSMDEVKTLADVFVKSGFFADTRDASQAIVKILAGRELGFPPLASMVGVYIVKGKPALSANLMATKVKASGKYTYRVVSHSADKCDLEFFERTNGGERWESIGRSVFTVEDARKAGTQNLDKFPRNMLFARAMSNGVKWHCPDVTNGLVVYTPDELGAPVNEDGEMLDVTPNPEPEPSQARPVKTVAPKATELDKHLSEKFHEEELDYQTNGASSKPAPQPAPRDEPKPTYSVQPREPVKAARIKLANWPEHSREIGELPYYQKNGQPDPYHILGSVAKMGYSEITAENVEEIKYMLKERAAEAARMAA